MLIDEMVGENSFYWKSLHDKIIIYSCYGGAND